MKKKSLRIPSIPNSHSKQECTTEINRFSHFETVKSCLKSFNEINLQSNKEDG